MKSWLVAVFGLAMTMAVAGPVRADAGHVPGGPCIEAHQQIQLSSLPSYDAVARTLYSIAATIGGGVEVHSAGLSGEGRPLLYATVGHGPDVFWLQARIHGNESQTTEAALQVLRYLATSGSPDARRILDRLTVVVVPMYNPDGATSNVRLSTNPLQIDLNRDWVLFRQPESRGFYGLWQRTRPRLALDLHELPLRTPVVNGTNDLNTFQIGARSLDPRAMTDEQWLTNRQMAMVSVAAVERMGTANVARYPLIHIPNAVISRMLLGGPGPDGSEPGFRTQGAIFYEIRSQAQKSNGMIEQLLVKPTMALLHAAADGSLYESPTADWDLLPFAHDEPCGGGPG